MIIGLAGNLNTGKDTVAKMLPRFRPIAFAKALKDIAGKLFDIPNDVLWGPSHFRDIPIESSWSDLYWMSAKRRLGDETLRARIREVFTDKHYAEALRNLQGMVEDRFDTELGSTVAPRHLLQQIGTEWGRAINPRVWLETVGRTIAERPQDNWVITDTRFFNEAKYAETELDGYVIWIDASERVKSEKTHASEPTREDLEPHVFATLDNNKSLTELGENVSRLLRVLWSQRQHPESKKI